MAKHPQRYEDDPVKQPEQEPPVPAQPPYRDRTIGEIQLELSAKIEKMGFAAYMDSIDERKRTPESP